MSAAQALEAVEGGNNNVHDFAEASVIAEQKRFELAQRKAAIYSKSSLVPKEYQNNIGNVLIAENMANRMGADTLMVMQNLYVVHGRPGWSATFLIACFNTCGRFSAIKYRFDGEPHSPEWGCVAYCKELATGEEIEGTRITWQMATAEGWVNKNGSKWKTMPEQMFRYRAATFLIRATAPEIGMGLLTKDELEDMAPENGGITKAANFGSGIDALKQRMAIGELSEGESEVVEGEATATQEYAESDFPLGAEPATEPADYIDASIHEPPTDAEADEATDATPDPLENLRADVQAAFDELPKAVGKNLVAGRTSISKASSDELQQWAIDIRKAAA